ncbi:hypothetical protein LAZ67_11000915 [Cordylochernes scorpioides]|uniref:Gag-Pol-p199 n=1 Tax=Cordylochernes scorpioides TaxID=51811 RepID=A0ABY6L0U3_9ARAC|nr:hypothetical protein LAZ67_11000915 [Cordylochernes scorpioides]
MSASTWPWSMRMVVGASPWRIFGRNLRRWLGVAAILLRNLVEWYWEYNKAYNDRAALRVRYRVFTTVIGMQSQRGPPLRMLIEFSIQKRYLYLKDMGEHEDGPTERHCDNFRFGNYLCGISAPSTLRQSLISDHLRSAAPNMEHKCISTCIPGLEALTGYYYYVIYGKAFSPSTILQEFKTQCGAPRLPPNNLTVFENPPGSINVSWENDSSYKVTWDEPLQMNGVLKNYLLKVSQSWLHTCDLPIIPWEMQVNQTTAILKLLPSSNYQINISAITVSPGDPAFLLLKTKYEVPRGMPQNLRVTEKHDEFLLLGWDPPLCNTTYGNITGYQVWTLVDVPWCKLNITSMVRAGHTWKLENPQPFTTYLMRVAAMNGEGISEITADLNLTIPPAVDRITEDSSMQRLTEVRDEYFADALTNMQPHCEDLVSRLTDAIRGIAVPRAEEALISPFDGSYAASNFIQQLERTSEGPQDDATLQARLRTLLKELLLGEGTTILSQQTILQDTLLVPVDHPHHANTAKLITGTVNGIAGILKQQHPDGTLHPVQYYSRALRSHEKNYTITELECLAVIDSVEKFRIYLAGVRFTIFTDHHALQWLKTIKKNPTDRLFRWSLKMSAYEYDIKYIKGKTQYEADLLSRNSLCGFLTTTQIIEKQPQLSPSTLIKTNIDGLHTIKRKGIVKIIVPPPLQHTLINKVHLEYNHPGVSQIIRLISTQYTWCGMTKSIVKYNRSCPTCQLIKKPKGPLYGRLERPPIALQPYDMLSIDTISGFSKYGNSKSYLHIIVDHLSRYTWTFPSKSTSIITYTQCLKKVLQCGRPKRLLSDRAPAFTSPKFRRFLIKNGIQPLLTTANNPQANGLCERLNATLTGKLRLLNLENPGTSWTKLIKIVTNKYNDTPHTITGFPPVFLMYNIIPSDLNNHINPYPNIIESRKLAIQRTNDRHDKDKIKYDNKHKNPHFDRGDLVLVKAYHHPNSGGADTPRKSYKQRLVDGTRSKKIPRAERVTWTERRRRKSHEQSFVDGKGRIGVSLKQRLEDGKRHLDNRRVVTIRQPTRDNWTSRQEKAKPATVLPLQRKAIRGTFTRIINEINGEFEKSQIDRNDIYSKFNRLESYYTKLVDLNEKYQALLVVKEGITEESIDREWQECDKYEEEKFDIQQKVSVLRNPDKEETIPIASEDTVINVKLPELALKSYDGSLEGWLPWWAQFSKIHENKNLSDSDRFLYLRQTIVPNSEAYRVVASYPVTGANYALAVQALQERFGDPNILTELYVRRLLNSVISNVKKENRNLSSLYDELSSHLRSLETLGIDPQLSGIFLYPLVESSLPSDILKIWHRHPSSGYGMELAKREESDKGVGGAQERLRLLLDFLKAEVRSAQRLKFVEKGFKQEEPYKRSYNDGTRTRSNFRPATVSSLFGGRTKIKCFFCERTNHASHQCRSIMKMSPGERNDKIRSAHLCFKCLRKGHLQSQCREQLECKNCGRNHLEVLCEGNSSNRLTKLERENLKENAPEPIASLSSQACTGQVLLMTTVALLRGPNASRRVRILLDSGSQFSYIKQSLVWSIGIERKGEITIAKSLFGGNKIGEEKHGKFMLELENLGNKRDVIHIEALDQRKICDAIPPLPKGDWLEKLKIKGIILSQDNFKGQEIDILIGANYLGMILTGKIVKVEADLTAVETKLGWTLMGNSPITDSNDNVQQTLNLLTTRCDLKDLWDLEVLGIRDPVETCSKETRYQEIKEKVITKIQRQSDQRYSVGLPWKVEKESIPSNLDIAIKRLDISTKKMTSQNKLTEYSQIFRDWLTEGLIERVEENPLERRGYYLPHRPVYKMESKTTPIRPVFDASCLGQNGLSLNQCLEKGPNLLERIPEMMIRFRENKFGVTADIRKAFQMVAIEESERNYLRFLWWEKESDRELIAYRHKRLVFGLNCSPFVLNAVIEYHLQSIRGPLVQWAKILAQSFYMDNCITSLETKQEVQEFQKAAIEIMDRAKMDLREWEYSLEENPEKGTCTKILGVVWNKMEDSLKCELPDNLSLQPKLTKRLVLSMVQRIFDPLGFCAPVFLPPKLLLQRSWGLKLGWDTPLPESMAQEFRTWLDQIKFIELIKIPRYMWNDLIFPTEVHIFCDASQIGYGAVAYLRSETGRENTLTLIWSKVRLAPMKSITIPRLELMAMVLGARLANAIQAALKRKCETTLWSDSTTALSWIKKEIEWRVFVRNRVREIQATTNLNDWRFVPSQLNPADLLSRGCPPSQFVQSIWWEGPEWWKKPKEFWPNSEFSINPKEIKEMLIKILGHRKLKYVQLQTALCEIESIINNRPLTYVSEDDNDLKTKNLKRIFWPKGRIVNLIPGKDGIVRVVHVKTSTGTLIRALQRLHPLEISSNVETIQRDNSNTEPQSEAFLGNRPNIESRDSRNRYGGADTPRKSYKQRLVDGTTSKKIPRAERVTWTERRRRKSHEQSFVDGKGRIGVSLKQRLEDGKRHLDNQRVVTIRQPTRDNWTSRQEKAKPATVLPLQSLLITWVAPFPPNGELDKFKIKYWRSGSSSSTTIELKIQDTCSTTCWIGQYYYTLMGLKLQKEYIIEPEKCEDCLIGKSYRLPFLQHSHKEEKEIMPLDLVHADLIGPLDVLSWGGAKRNPGKFKEWIQESEKQTSRKLKRIRTDNGLEFCSKEWDTFCTSVGIVHEHTMTYTPQQNGVAERMTRTLLDLVRSTISGSGLPKASWAELTYNTAYVRNRVLNNHNGESTPYELWTGNKPSLKHKRAIGCQVFVHIPRQVRKSKLERRAVKGNLVGYALRGRGYRVWIPEMKKVVESRDCVFKESDVSRNDSNREVLPSVEHYSYGTQREIEEYPVSLLDQEDVTPTEEDSHNEDTVKPSPTRSYPMILRNQRNAQNSIELLSTEVNKGDPTSYKEAIQGPEAEHWLEAIEEELESLRKHRVWELTELPKHSAPIACKWVLHKKTNAEGQVVRYKARLVAKGFTQQKGIDYDEIYSPVSSFETTRLLTAIGVENNWFIDQYDVKSAYLYGKLDRVIYMEQPEGFVKPGEEHLYCQLKRSLYGLKQSGRCWNKCLDVWLKKRGFMRNPVDPCVYKLKLNEGMIISSLYVDDILTLTENQEVRERCIVLLRGHFETKYIGPVSYLLGVNFTRSKADKARHCLCSKSIVARYCSKYTRKHWVAAKRILRYLKSSEHLGITYRRTGEQLCVYSDADWGTNLEDRKSTSGYVPTPVWCDNQAAIAHAKSYISRSKTRHIAIRYHFVREKVDDGVIQLDYVTSGRNLADILTKPLGRNLHELHRSRLLNGEVIHKEGITSRK